MMLIPTLFIVTVLAFGMVRLLPSDAVNTWLLANRLQRTEENIAKAEERFGLNDPLPIQYAKWLRDVCRLDFGQSYANQKPVAGMIGRAFINTLELALAALIWIVILTPLLGIGAARHPDGFMDRFTRIFCLTGTAVPTFVLGFFLIRFLGVQLKILPISGKTSILHFILPSFTLSISHIAYFVQMLRNEMLENKEGAYVLYARARGIPQNQIFYTHILKNSIMPVINTLGISFGRLIAGTVVIENVFSWPGLGQMITKAILSRDYPVIQGYILIIALVFSLSNLISDLLSALVDPRIRLGVKE